MTAHQTRRSLRYLSAGDVRGTVLSLSERLDLAERVMVALEGSAELPPKIGVHPRQPGSLAHAMPALLRGEAADGSDDLIGMKWIAGFPENIRLGLPAYHALVIVNDPLSGVPIGVLDGGPITAQRTAAISGVAIRHFGAGHAVSAAVLGAGVQAAAHLEVVGHLLPGSTVRLVDRDRDRARGLAREWSGQGGIASVEVVDSIERAVDGAGLVISAVSFGPHRQALDPARLRPDVLFVAVDYDMQAPASLASEALFVTDSREQFLATRTDAVFADYPDPDLTLGAALRDGATRPAGRVLVSHLGVGLADVVFAYAILERAERLGLGVSLAL